MLKKEAEQRQAIEMLCTDMLVPKGHLLRKIDAAVNFARIYELVEDLYCEDNGRPSCDPVVLFKLVLIQHLFGIRSLRQTMRDAEVNVAYRWFLGYTMSQQLPHFATISYAFRHRFTAEVIEGVFRWILEEVARAGYLSAEVVFVDGTHIKANANLKKQMKKAIPVAAKRYQEQLDEEIEADRAAHGKKPLKKDDDDDGPCASGKEKMVAESTTDPESGVFHKGEHKKCFAYEAHTVCDRRGYILETEITPGNVHDSVAFDTVFERLKAHYPEVQVVTADAGYKTPWICKQIFDSGKIPSLPYKRPMTKKGNLPWYAYVYDEYYDCILCPQDKVLSYATTNREGYREYKSKSYICRDCPELEKCTQNRQYTKTVTRHIWQEYLDVQLASLGHAYRSGFANGIFNYLLEFKGQIEKVKPKHICFKRIFISGMYTDGTMFDGKEDHVWMDKSGFEECAVGDSVSFCAEVYRYVKTGNGKLIDYGLRNPTGIQKIEAYELPSDDELIMQEVEQLICETCFLSEQCNRNYCTMDPKKKRLLKQEMFRAIKAQIDKGTQK